MIASDRDLKGTQERIAYFQNLLAQFRVTATPTQFPLMASGYRAEIERMQEEVMAYLTRHVSRFLPKLDETTRSNSCCDPLRLLR